jgi:aspartate kinase
MTQTMFRPTIMKFGGTSVQDSAAFRRLLEIVESQRAKTPVVLVVSAMSGVTNTLLAAAAQAAGGDPQGALASLEPSFLRHIEVSETFLPPEAFNRFNQRLRAAHNDITELLSAIAVRPEHIAVRRDAVVAYGEKLSAALLDELLRARGISSNYVDASRCIITDDEHGRATPQFEITNTRIVDEISPLLEMGVIPVMGGFISSTIDGVITTLGRGGSDYTAAIIGAPLFANEIQIWTDVTGVLTADPRVVPQAQTIPRLSYLEAAELAYFGAKVLHPKTIHPAVQQNIPVRICNSRDPLKTGTVVKAEPESTAQIVKAIAHKSGITTVHITSGRMLGAYGFLHRIFETFARHRMAVDIVTTSEVSVSLSLDDTTSLNAVVSELNEIAAVTVERGRAIVCVVGEGLRTTPGIAGRVFSTVGDINVSLISQGGSKINLTFVVEQDSVNEVVRRLHAEFFGKG